MEEYKIPAIYCPVGAAVSPYREQLHERSLRWASDMGLAPEGANAHRYLSTTRLSDLAAYNQPFAAKDDVQISADLFVWLFMHDDCNVDGAFGALDVEELRRVNAGLFAALDGLAEPTTPLERGLHDLRRRAAAISDGVWMRRFNSCMKEYLLALEWGRILQAQQRPPDLATYNKLRPLTGATYISFVVNNVISGISSGCSFWRHPGANALTDMVALYVCWVNDIFSYNKECIETNYCNLLWVLRQEFSLSLQEAANLAVDMLNKEMVAFQSLKAALPSLIRGEDAELRKYVSAMEQWLPGVTQFSSRSARYRSELLIRAREDSSTPWAQQ